MKYAAIEVHRAQFSVRLMCRVLGVSRAGFYASGKRAASARAKRDEELRTQIRAVHQQSRRTYGSPRVHAELRAQGERCGRKRVARLMRQEGLRVKVRRRFRPTTTDSRHPHPVPPMFRHAALGSQRSEHGTASGRAILPLCRHEKGGCIWPSSLIWRAAG